MCHMIVVSTNSTADLSKYDDRLFSFIKEMPHLEEMPAASQLRYAECWYLSGEGGCGCSFRHASYQDSFSIPEEWYPEDEEDIEATRSVFRVFKGLVEQGFSVDLICTWANSLDGLNEIPVNVHQISEDAFLFFEDVHFLFER